MKMKLWLDVPVKGKISNSLFYSSLPTKTKKKPQNKTHVGDFLLQTSSVVPLAAYSAETQQTAQSRATTRTCVGAFYEIDCHLGTGFD